MSLPLVPVPNQMNSVHAFHPFSFRTILILSFHQPLDLRNVLFRTSFPTNIMCVVSLCMCHMPWPWYSPHFDAIIRSDEKYKSCSSSLYSFLYCLITSLFLGSNIFLRTIFLNTSAYIRSEKKVKLAVCAWGLIEGVKLYLVFKLSTRWRWMVSLVVEPL